MRLAILLLLSAPLAGCATTGGRTALEDRDPLERFNRGMWSFNSAVDKAAVKPVTKAYRKVMPNPVRRGVTRVFSNLAEPFSAMNTLLQGKPKRALNSLGRFAINTTVGVGGLGDPATKMGLPEAREDFGQTLAAWGAKTSPYLVLPLFGPSTVRDGVGTVVGFVADPAQIAINSQLSGTGRAAVAGSRFIDARSQVIDSGADRAMKGAADPYATARSAFFQRRRAQLRDQADTAASGDEGDLLQKALNEDAAFTPPEKAAPPPPPAARPAKPVKRRRKH
jgi:phospholipid-binding lipoprotein MlaA